MTRRRRATAPGLVVISWRDIPAQVTAVGVDTEAKAVLPSRFQKAIDRAARVAGKTDHRAYIGEWQRHTRPLAGDDPQAAVDALVAELDTEHDRETGATVVRQGGYRSAADAAGADERGHTEEHDHAEDPGGTR